MTFRKLEFNVDLEECEPNHAKNEYRTATTPYAPLEVSGVGCRGRHGAIAGWKWS